MAKYNHFTPQEVEGLSEDLCKFLDKAREIACTPFIITSGLRSVEQNQAVGGVPNSSHLKGLAVDIACATSYQRWKIVYGIIMAGVPCFIEIALRHIHVDIDKSIHPMNLIDFQEKD